MLTTSRCLNILGCCHVTGGLDIYLQEQLNRCTYKQWRDRDTIANYAEHYAAVSG